MSAVVIDGGVVHYEYLGRGRPVIFIHGWLGSWRYWMPAMSDLSDAYRTYALDLWGFGDTDKLRARYTLSEYVQLLISFMDELGIARTPLLVGHSLGALVALNMAIAKPEMVDRLTVVSLPLDKHDIDHRALVNGKGITGGGFFRKHRGYESVLNEMDKTDRGAIEGSLSSLNGIDIRGTLAALQVPTVSVYGGRDTIISFAQDVSFSSQDAAKTETSVVRPMPMPQARHFPMLEDTSVFNRLLRDFLLTDVSDPGVIHSLAFKEEWRRKMR